MDYIDKLITTQAQIIMTREQTISLMELHLKAIEEWAKDIPFVIALAITYREAIEQEKKNMEPHYRMLEQYQDMKKRLSAEE